MICKIIFKNKIYEINEFLEDIHSNYTNNDFIIIKLMILNNIINAEQMFEGCNYLVSITNINNYNRLYFNKFILKI